VIARVLALGALLSGVAACGGGDPSTLEAAEEAMADLRAGELVLELTASSPDGGPVGFRMEGPYSIGGEGELPVFDLTYTQLAGEAEVVTQVVSTGAAAFVVVDGEATEIEGDAASALRMGEGEGFTGLGIAGWVVDPIEEQRGDDTIVTGRVDAADLLGDLARIVSQVAGAGDAASPSGDDVDRLRGLVRSSEAEVVVGADDLPRAIDLSVDFGGEVPDELVDALGPYAAATLDLHLELEAIDAGLEVDAPAVSG
jgi:hypothetical protein